jgi:hypothetical protein
MTVFGRSLPVSARRAAVLAAFLCATALQPGNPALRGQTSSSRPTLYQRLGGYEASRLTLHSCSLASRSIPSSHTCSADTARTASSDSSNWSSN